jgi:hypothetical protein
MDHGSRTPGHRIEIHEQENESRTGMRGGIMNADKDGSGFFEDQETTYSKDKFPNHRCPLCCFLFKEGQKIHEVKVESQGTSFFYHEACYLA